MIDVHGKETLYEYYNDGRLLSVTYEGQLFSYTYDAVGRLGSLTYPTNPDTLVLNFTWDDDGRLLSMEYLKNRAAFQGFTYGYDDSGNRVTMDEVGPGSVTTNWEYGYDWFNRLTSVTKNTILQESYTYDESDNRKTMSRPLVNELWEYSYDLADQLESITVTVDAGSPTLVESFESDEDGNMLTRDKGGVVTEYRWDSQNRLTQVKVDGDVVVRSIYDAFMQGHQLLGVEQGGNLHYYLVDGLANVRLVLDSSGSIVASTVFDEFGIPEDVSGSADLRPHGYTGGLGVRNDWDSSDLHYMRHRYYDPQLGRWLSADPIGFAGGLNLHNYVGQNPINRVDPSGLIFSETTSVVVVPHVGVTGIFLETVTTGAGSADITVSIKARVGSGNNYKEIPIYSGKDYANKAFEKRAPKELRSVDLGSVCAGSTVDTVLVISNDDLKGALTLEVIVNTVIMQGGKVAVSNVLRAEVLIRDVQVRPDTQLPQPRNEGRPERYTDGF